MCACRDEIRGDVIIAL